MSSATSDSPTSSSLYTKKAYLAHLATDEVTAKASRLRQAFSDLDVLITELTPFSRERAITLTYLETAAMWAVKAAVHNDLGSVSVPVSTLTPRAE